MTVNWWRGIKRIYSLVSLIWLIAVALMAWVSPDDIAVPLRDERVLGSLSGCAPASGDVEGLFANSDYRALPVETKLEIIHHLCPRATALYGDLSEWGKQELLKGDGLVTTHHSSTFSMTPGRREVLGRVLPVAALGLIPPILGYLALIAGRWALRGFQAEAG